MYFMLKEEEYSRAKFGMTAISTNPNVVSPVVWKYVQLDTSGDHFGELGNFKRPDNINDEWTWTKQYDYKAQLNIYEVVRVLDVEPKSQQSAVLIVYGCKIGEGRIMIPEAPNWIKTITPYHVRPQIDHKLLLKNARRDPHHNNMINCSIVHNVTLAIKKWEMDQHII